MEYEVFTDGIVEVGFVGGAVRLHLGTYRPEGNDPKVKPQLKQTGCVIMTPEGFVGLFNGLQEVMNKFEKSGLIKKQEPQGEKQEAKAAAPVSPNFAS